MEYNVKRYVDILSEENERHNLVSRKSFAQDVDKHIIDSLSVLQFERLVDKKVVDIGSGAGFPALILAMKCSNSNFVLIESNLKKSSFLSRVVEELNLSNVEVIRGRVEEIGQDLLYRNQFDICTSRAVAPLNVMLEYGLPLLKTGGQMWLWKGRNYPTEVDEAQNALKVLKAKVMQVHLYTLLEERDRAIVIVKKQEDISQKYPRRIGIPKKQPL
ncbi:MAG TPA: 16S rRNA (guanine(527)-N(7))-methyltransferase RsmG [Syntrophomonadaceae bacterium]|nr:16S rRNA (guanine(527)-N(7))-methyltransferase RsmG [Syntrophomonadaceae bacterium]